MSAKATVTPLHPFIGKMLAAAKAAGRPGLAAGTPEAARVTVAAARAALGAGPEVGDVQALRLPSRAGATPARLYRTKNPERGLIVYLHGGGWVCGTLDDFDGLARTLADTSGCAVLLVDYRLAPEHPFPAALHDAEDALLWAHGEAMALLDRRVPLVVAGDSAGANLGIAAALATQDRIALAGQMLFYPVTDCDFDRSSYRELSEGMPVTRADMRWFFGHYAPCELWADPRIAVLRAPKLHGSPPSYIATAEYDVLRDEGEAYAQCLREAGVEVQLQRVAGLPHGFARMGNLVDSARAAVEQAALAAAAHCDAHIKTSIVNKGTPHV